MRLGALALAVIVSLPAAAQIAVTSATYGGNVGAPAGNATAPVAAQCNGTQACSYVVVYYHFLPDPAPGQAKAFSVSWSCGGVGQYQTFATPTQPNGEAGYGAVANLSCAAPTPTPTPVVCPPCPCLTPTPTPTPCPTCSPTPTPTPTPPGTACTTPPSQFEPNPPGAQRPATLSTGFTNSMTVYGSGARLFNQESFGYSTLTLGSPGHPSALRYDDLRFSGVPAAGDGQSYTFGSMVSADGNRAVIGLGGPGDGWGVIVGTADGAEGFAFVGSFGLDRASAVITYAAARYIAYGITTGGSVAADVTSLPTSMVKHNMEAQADRISWAGYLPKAVGTYVTFLSGSGLTIVDGSNPGPVGSITNGMPLTVLTASDFGGRAIQYYTATGNGTGLYVLVELRPLAGEASYTYSLVSIAKAGLSKTVMGSWKVPTLPGETWAPAGISAAISNGRVFMPALRMAPSYSARAYVAPLSGFPGAPALTSTAGIGSFGMPAAATGPYVYLPTGAAGFVLPCGAQ